MKNENSKRITVKDFMKNHKKEIFIGAMVAVGGAVLFAVTRKKPDIQITNMPTLNNILMNRDIPIPDMSIGDISDFWMDGGVTPHMIVNELTPENIGPFMKELSEKVDIIKPDSSISAILCFVEE